MGWINWRPLSWYWGDDWSSNKACAPVWDHRLVSAPSPSQWVKRKSGDGKELKRSDRKKSIEKRDGRLESITYRGVKKKKGGRKSKKFYIFILWRKENEAYQEMEEVRWNETEDMRRDKKTVKREERREGPIMEQNNGKTKVRKQEWMEGVWEGRGGGERERERWWGEYIKVLHVTS